MRRFRTGAVALCLVAALLVVSACGPSRTTEPAKPRLDEQLKSEKDPKERAEILKRARQQFGTKESNP